MNDDDQNLDWQDGQPLSRRFGDVYFSRASGIEETRHVFLSHNRLHERWSALSPGDRFVIAETGFGSGLNFLCAWQLWRHCAPQGATLHFVSIEKYPLSPAEMKQALTLWPELAPLRNALLQHYGDLSPGWHRLHLAADAVLTLVIGDVAEVMPQLDLRADAWFLDGFAPARNPAMWTADVLRTVAERTRPGGTFATYTAAGEVRRNLEAAGFVVERVKGYGTKREMLRGISERTTPAQAPAPWYARPPAVARDRRAVVIGGGLAGASAAASLAQRGWQVSLIERHPTLAAEASGNPQGILYTRLAAHATPLREWVISGYSHTLRMLEHLALPQDAWQRCGVLQLAFDDAETTRQQKLLAQHFPAAFFHGVDRAQATALSGINLPAGGLYFPRGGWVAPGALCRALAAHSNIETLLTTEALSLERCGAGWHVYGPHGVVASAPVVLIASAKDTVAFGMAQHLPLKIIRGQISLIPQTDASVRLRTVVCAERYVAPAHEGWHTVGATHKFDDCATEVRPREHRENLEALRTLAPALYQALDADRLDLDRLPGRAGIRVSTPDYLPLIGPLVDASAFNERYAALRRDASLRIDAPAPWLPGLYVTTAHGSRGLITAPLAGEVLAAYINDEPAPLSSHATQAAHPSRFLLRGLIRGSKDQGA